MSKKSAEGYQVGTRPVPAWIDEMINTGQALMLNKDLPSEQVVILSACTENKIHKRGEMVHFRNSSKKPIAADATLEPVVFPDESTANMVERIGDETAD